MPLIAPSISFCGSGSSTYSLANWYRVSTSRSIWSNADCGFAHVSPQDHQQHDHGHDERKIGDEAVVHLVGSGGLGI